MEPKNDPLRIGSRTRDQIDNRSWRIGTRTIWAVCVGAGVAAFSSTVLADPLLLATSYLALSCTPWCSSRCAGSRVSPLLNHTWSSTVAASATGRDSSSRGKPFNEWIGHDAESTSRSAWSFVPQVGRHPGRSVS